MKASLIVWAIVLCFLSLGCGIALERPAPTREGFIALYLECFDASQVDKIDYVFKGAIGGTMTVGRVQFKGPVKLENTLIEQKVKAGLLTEGTYDPAEMTKEPAAMKEFKDLWEVHADGKLPSWFDFPFNRKMRTMREALKEVPNVRPHSEKVWYIDDDRNVVYIRANCG